MYVPTKIDDHVYRNINRYFSTERVLCNIGWVSMENPGIKLRPKYLNSFNFPTKVDEIDYISQFAREGNIDVIRGFYRQTNGMRLLCGKFNVPGVLFHSADFSGLDFYCVALDFSGVGGLALPRFSPENGFVIGESQRAVDGSEIRVHDIVTKSGEIIGGIFDEHSGVTDRFSTIEEWLAARIDAAARDLKLEISQLKQP